MQTNEEFVHTRDRFDRLITTLYATNAAYHNEKERMAHNIILLEMALLGAVITSHGWLSLSNFQYNRMAIMIAFGATCFLVHMHLRWQLRNRRSAAILVAAIQNAMVRWVSTSPTLEEMAPPQLQRIRPPLLILIVPDFLFPLKPGLKVNSDASLPDGILQEILKQKKTPLHGEWLVSITSVVMLVAALWIFALPSC